LGLTDGNAYSEGGGYWKEGGSGRPIRQEAQDGNARHRVFLSWWQSSDMRRRLVLTHCGIKKRLTQVAGHGALLRSNDMW